MNPMKRIKVDINRINFSRSVFRDTGVTDFDAGNFYTAIQIDSKLLNKTKFTTKIINATS